LIVGESRFKLVLTGLLVAVVVSTGVVQAKTSAVADRMASISVAELPAQGAQTYALIAQGGPFPNEKDGIVFGNRERLLPSSKRGYYREYTVHTPGVGHRGTRRIVCGGQPRVPDACYYTADHYASFRRIVP
jgi:ribonuclease T1